MCLGVLGWMPEVVLYYSENYYYTTSNGKYTSVAHRVGIALPLAVRFGAERCRYWERSIGKKETKITCAFMQRSVAVLLDWSKSK